MRKIKKNMKKNEMVSITESTYAKLCTKVKLKKALDKEMFIKHVYNDERIFNIFNKYEVRVLFNLKNLLQECDVDDSDFTFLLHVPKRKDTKKYVFEKESFLKYHLNDNCEALFKDYLDFYIPQDLREKGDFAIEDYRTWFKNKGYKEDYLNGKLDQEAMIFQYNMKFPKLYKVMPLKESFKLVQIISNKGSRKVKRDFNYDNFVSSLEQQIKYYYQVFSCDTLRKLSKFRSLKTDNEIKEKFSNVFSPQFVENYGIERIREKFDFANEIIGEIFKLLKEYIRWNLGTTEYKIKSASLDDYGLKCCAFCKEDAKANDDENLKLAS